uniref:Uncharacterized protein n=1 Tax=Nelumbo nucifera TaxID=4432 RepID=A0A822Z4M8_NELNU|nr:TPA_asm: hypothetical protein HUJ06_007129 [Nelumbo nucifera]
MLFAGVYGICSSPDKDSQLDCLSGYRPLDNIAKGFYPKRKLDRCIENPSLMNFTVEVINDADFPHVGLADLARVTPTNEEGCKKALMDETATDVRDSTLQFCNLSSFMIREGRR